jgi:hypothetical protein
MKIQRQPLRKLTKAYLVKFFRNKNLAFQEWNITINGVNHVANNYSIIEMITKARYEEQRELADALYELDAADRDINMFLKHLAIECNIVDKSHSAETEGLLKVG